MRGAGSIGKFDRRAQSPDPKEQMRMTMAELEGAADYHAEKASEVAEFLALPGDYFSARGSQHWYQVVSRSEVEQRLATDLHMIAHYEAQITACDTMARQEEIMTGPCGAHCEWRLDGGWPAC
jgi:hypothetical protein